MTYKNFKLSDLFDIVGTKSLDAGQLSFIKDGVNFVGRIFENNGVQGKIEKQNFEPNQAYTITATVIGNYKYVKLQEEEYYCSQNINKLIPKAKKLSTQVLLYFVTHIQKFVSKWDGQQGGYKLEDIKNHIISLPTIDGINPDYNYMDAMISELKKDCMNELDKYLRATGLDDCCLNNKDMSILNATKKFKNYKVCELFDIHPTKTYGINNSYLLSKDGTIPVVANTSNNNGIGGYSSLKPNEKGGIITFSDTTTADSIFYQPNDFIGYSHVQGMYPFSDLWNHRSLQYFMTVFKNVALSKNFDYANKFNRKLALNFIVSLPTTDGSNLDYEYMEKYIRVIEKIVVKDVVAYKDKEIKETK